MFKIDDGSVAGVECCICNSAPTKSEFAIDTEVSAVDVTRPQLGVLHRIVCQKCAEALVELVPNKGYDKAKAEVAKWKTKYADLMGALHDFTQDSMNVSD